GDAAGGELGVVGNDGGEGIPVDAGARHVMGFEMVGMQFDKSRRQQAAAEIRAGFRWRAFADLGDAAIHTGDPTVVDNAVCEHPPGIRQDEGLCTFGVSGCSLDRCRSSHGQASFEKGATSMRRSAMAVRTSSSWTTARTATPRFFFSAMRSTTAALLAASRE